MTQECDCGAATFGTWAGIHHSGCASVQAADVTSEDQQVIADLLAENSILRSALRKYREAQRFATGTEMHRLALQAADENNPVPHLSE